MQPTTGTDSEVDRKDEKTPLVANAIDEGILLLPYQCLIMYNGMCVCVRIVMWIASINNAVIVWIYSSQYTK